MTESRSQLVSNNHLSSFTSAFSFQMFPLLGSNARRNSTRFRKLFRPPTRACISIPSLAKFHIKTLINCSSIRQRDSARKKKDQKSRGGGEGLAWSLAVSLKTDSQLKNILRFLLLHCSHNLNTECSHLSCHNPNQYRAIDKRKKNKYCNKYKMNRYIFVQQQWEKKNLFYIVFAARLLVGLCLFPLSVHTRTGPCKTGI